MEFGGSHGFAVEFDDDASGKQLLAFQELLQGAGEIHARWLSVGDDDVSHDGSSLSRFPAKSIDFHCIDEQGAAIGEDDDDPFLEVAGSFDGLGAAHAIPAGFAQFAEDDGIPGDLLGTFPFDTKVVAVAGTGLGGSEDFGFWGEQRLEDIAPFFGSWVGLSIGGCQLM